MSTKWLQYIYYNKENVAKMHELRGMEESDMLYEFRGYDGQIELYENKIIIKRKGRNDFFLHGNRYEGKVNSKFNRYRIKEYIR